MGDKTTIPIESDTRDRLRGEKQGNETYTDVITRLLDRRKVVERSIKAARDAAERAENASDDDTEAFHTGIGAAHRGIVEEYGTEEDLDAI